MCFIFFYTDYTYILSTIVVVYMDVSLIVEMYLHFLLLQCIVVIVYPFNFI